MEQAPENVVATIPNATTTDPPHHDEPKRPRKRMHVFKVALSRMGSKRSEKPKVLPVDDDGSKSVWKKLLGSMRPMHLQLNQSPRASSPQSDGNGLQEQLQVTMPTPSPSEYNTDGGDDGSHSPSPASSRYASAVGLNEMVQGDEDGEIKQENMVVAGEKKEHGDNGEGDEMIDAKADEFIAQFYKQMKLQRMDTMDRLYKERSNRSLGW